MENQFNIFISYKRKSLPTGNNLYYRLTTRGYFTFFNLEEMGMDNFNTQLLKYIENAKDVFVILEEGSLDACQREDWERDWFCHEIAFAVEKKKNIILIPLNGYKMHIEDFFSDELKELSYRQAPKIFFSFFEAYLSKLIEKVFLLSKPTLQDRGVSVFKFYSNEDSIFLPAAGCIKRRGNEHINEYGYYWTREASLNLEEDDVVRELLFGVKTKSVESGRKNVPQSSRPVFNDNNNK